MKIIKKYSIQSPQICRDFFTAEVLFDRLEKCESVIKHFFLSNFMVPYFMCFIKSFNLKVNPGFLWHAEGKWHFLHPKIF